MSDEGPVRLGARATDDAPKHVVAHSRRNTRAVAWTTGVAFVVFITVAVWATDFVTFQGEWTIYTASCQGGTWNGPVCSGSLRPGPRYRFRALKAHREVLYWTSGESGRSGRYVDCDIEDGRHWECPPDETAPLTITHRMVHGIPSTEGTGRNLPFHRIPKWKWEALRVGLPIGSSASN